MIIHTLLKITKITNVGKLNRWDVIPTKLMYRISKNIFFKYYALVTNNSVNLLRNKRIKNIVTN